jgi:hypothetical protein
VAFVTETPERRARHHEGALYVAPELRRELKHGNLPANWARAIVAGVLWLVALFALFFAVAMIFLLILMVSAKAHEAMSGWPYPAECCGGNDCWQLPEDAVTETLAGFTIKASGEFVARASAKPSGDEYFHLCRYPGPKIRCLFFPNRGF